MILSLSFSFLSATDIFAAKKPHFEEGEVDKPTGEANAYKSEGIIIDKAKNEEINPLHATPSYIESEEYKLVDNFIIDIRTMPNRIKYFSPTYLNYKTVAENQVKTSLYAAGGNKYNLNLIKNTMRSLPSQKETASNTLKNLQASLNQLISHGIHSGPQYEALVSGIEEVSIAIATIDATNVSLSQAAIGYGSAVRMLNNIDSNSNMTYLNNTLSKSLINAFLSYKQLEHYIRLLDMQVSLYQDMFNLYRKNYELGLATSQEVQQYLINYENAKKTRNNIKATANNVKEMIAINLGYERKDFDKLYFAEPEVDLTYAYETSPSIHYEQAYNSNKTYNNIRSAARVDSKNPGSTADSIRQEKLDATKIKIITKLDRLYDEMRINLYKFNASVYSKEIISLNEIANNRKLENNLVSEMEYRGLVIKNEADRLAFFTTKYDFIKSTVNYHYGILGILDVD